MNRPVLSLKPKKTEETWFNARELAVMPNSWIKTAGTLVYEPYRGQEFRKTFKAKTLVLNFDRDDLDLYYQWFLEKQVGTWYQLQRPMFGLHVTVVRGDEKIKNVEAWKKYSGRELTVEYNPVELRKKWQFWSIPVRSKELEEIRRELGLTAAHDFHLTVAREYDHLKLGIVHKEKR